MGGFLGGAPKPVAQDTSQIDKQTKMAEEDRAKKERENASRLRALRGGRSGFTSLLYGDETGVPAKKTLG